MAIVPAQPIAISIASTAAHLPVVRAAATEIAQLVGLSDRSTHEVVLALDEALANVIEHAYEGRQDQPISVTFTALCECGRQLGLSIVIEDRGSPVDPQRLRGRDLADVRPGGLGTHIMSACMNRIEYAAREGGGTRLTLIKYLPAAAAPASPAAPVFTGDKCG